jgi:hypothetical protein
MAFRIIFVFSLFLLLFFLTAERVETLLVPAYLIGRAGAVPIITEFTPKQTGIPKLYRGCRNRYGRPKLARAIPRSPLKGIFSTVLGITKCRTPSIVCALPTERLCGVIPAALHENLLTRAHGLHRLSTETGFIS